LIRASWPACEEPGEPIAAIGSLIVFAAMLYFALLVYRSKA